MPLITIIIPNRNNGHYLADCLQSVQNQTITDWECIIIDDGSTDKSHDIIEKFRTRDKRFRPIYNQATRGVSAARNRGLDAAAGEWICFLDSDDILLPAAFEIMLYGAAVSNSDIIEGGVINAHQDFIPPHLPAVFDPHAATIFCYENLFADLPRHCNNMAWIWRRLYRAGIAKHIRFPENIEINEDLLWFLDVIAQNPKMAKINLGVLYHRIWTQSLTRGAGPMRRLDQLITVVERVDENRAIPRLLLDSIIFNLTRCVAQYEMHEINNAKIIITSQLRHRIRRNKKYFRLLPRQMRRFVRLFIIKQYLLNLAYGHDKN